MQCLQIIGSDYEDKLEYCILNHEIVTKIII